MARSVETVGDNVTYFDCSAFDEWSFEDLVINLQDGIKARFSSMVKVNKWTEYPYRENYIILENDFVCVSISQYCDCGAVSVYVNPDCEIPELAEYWIDKTYYSAIRGIVKRFTTVINRIGTFSNGESVYEKAID